MNVIQILGIGLVAAILSVLVKQHRPELAIMLPILAAVAILLYLTPYLRGMLQMFQKLADVVGLGNQYLEIVIKMIGVAYLSQFAAELCKDAGEASIAGKIELAGKVMILTLSMPVIYRLLELVSDIINF